MPLLRSRVIGKMLGMVVGECTNSRSGRGTDNCQKARLRKKGKSLYLWSKAHRLGDPRVLGEVCSAFGVARRLVLIGHYPIPK